MTLPVRRPGDVRDGVDAGDANLVDRAASRRRRCRGSCRPSRRATKARRLRVRRPGAGGVDEAQRVEVRVAIGGDEAADDLAGVRVGEEEVDVEEVARREERDVAAVGAERGTEVQVRLASFSFPRSGAPRRDGRHARRPGCTARARPPASRRRPASRRGRGRGRTPARCRPMPAARK